MKVGDMVIFKKPPVRNTSLGLKQENKYDTVGIIIKTDYLYTHVSWNFLGGRVGRNLTSDLKVINLEEDARWQT